MFLWNVVELKIKYYSFECSKVKVSQKKNTPIQLLSITEWNTQESMLKNIGYWISYMSKEGFFSKCSNQSFSVHMS